jgi:broad specificity phosphatase PhoE
MESRKESAKDAMKDLKKWLNQSSDDDTTGKVAIYDGTNTTRERRDWILEQLNEFHADGAKYKLKVMFIESICNDESIVSQNIQATKLSMPDYKDHSSDDALKDFKKRVLHYKSMYETIDPTLDAELSWVKLIDGGRMVTSNNMHGFLPGRILHFVMNLHTVPRPIYLSRHGESQYNRVGKIGGDSDLTDYGNAYAVKLGEFSRDHIMADDPHARLWTSSLLRTINTAKHVPHDVQPDGWISMRPRQWRHLDEIHAGIFDGMTYQQIKEIAPDEYEARKENKLTYRYPRGESYLDVMQRLDPIIHELERQTDPVLLVGHQGILRIIYAYFMGLNRFETPFVAIDFNTVTKLTPEAYECGVEKYLLLEHKGPKDAPSH